MKSRKGDPVLPGIRVRGGDKYANTGVKRVR
jgi:hypothetical protein